MTRYPICLRTVLTLLIVVSGVSASQAGLFGRWRNGGDYNYYYSACPPAAVATPQASVPAAGQPAANGPGLVYQAAKPVIGENAAAARFRPGSRLVCSGAVRTYSNSGPPWSTQPRSAWDYGKFPPYSN